MKKVKKAVIPAAGLGTRFLPATKTVPKEMLPIIDKPIIFYIVEEAVKAGIEDIIFIAGRGKSSIEDFFDYSVEVESKIEKDNKSYLLEELYQLRDKINIISVRQKVPLGLGHAVLCASPIVGREPFAVLLGDEIMISKDDFPTVTKQLINCYEKEQLSTVAIMEVPLDDVNKYGIVDIINSGQKSDNIFRVKSVVEKPSKEKAPSCYALPGRYIFDAQIFNYIKETKPGVLGEIQLTDGMTKLANNEGLLASTFKAQRYDAGDKMGFLQANIELALNRKELKGPMQEYIKNIANKL